ncbi:OmpA/MotB family protein [Thermoleophilum album]|uniref:Chemotaxis protein MotB n=1 Tax=Thermoleophilum album TaxID=29539 RepID=A0A1H6FWF9_THEAL|nr:flagellar motor protein MotB [Thermoleophilum album]SEH14640.1 chemotaxis protein MotB [Thermoleophilum album]
MAGRRASRRRRAAHAEHENEERWLLTYSDMITLLMALFIVMFAISNVNKSKLEALRQSLEQAFSGAILPGGHTVRQVAPPSRSPAPPQAGQAQSELVENQIQRDDADFREIKRRLDRYIHAHHLEREVRTLIDERGLMIRLLTDRILFDSGSAELKSQSAPLLSAVADMLKLRAGLPISVEGHTDPVPISGRYPSNWELSTARAARVVRALVARGIPAQSLSATGYAWLHPIASNATPAGRARNRRVEIVLLRSGLAQRQTGPLTNALRVSITQGAGATR